MQECMKALLSLLLAVLVVADITPAGRGTNVVCSMQAAVPIPLSGLSGNALTMAKIFNSKGSWLYKQAARMGVKPKDLAAVLKVESGGDGFAIDGRMIIRFENHIFYNYFTNNGKDEERKAIFNQHYQFSQGDKKWEGHMWRRSPSDEWMTFHGNQTREWEVLTFSQQLDDTAALLSHSMGSPQVMGFNYQSIGYSSVQEMFQAFSTSLEAQLNGLVQFILNRPNCINGLRNGDYVQFASCYNGPGQAETYKDAILAAVTAWETVTAKRCGTEEGEIGQCKAAGSSCAGTTYTGLCATASDICCVGEEQPNQQAEIWGWCETESGPGVCIDTSMCTGTTYRGLCPGPSNIRCCVSTANAVSYGNCTVSGQPGQCVEAQSCSAGSSSSGCSDSVCCPKQNICSAAWVLGPDRTNGGNRSASLHLPLLFVLLVLSSLLLLPY